MAVRGKGMVPYGQEGGLPAEIEPDYMNPGFDPGSVGEDSMSDDLALMNTLAQIGAEESEAKVNVYQIDAQKKDVFLYSCSVGEFAANGLEEIQSRYGAGEYRIRVYNNGRVLTHRRVPVGAPRVPAVKEVAQTPGVDLAGLFAQQTSLMMEGFKQLGETLASRMPQPESETAMLQRMMMYKELFAGNTQRQEQPPMQIMLDMLKQGMELGRMGSGEPSSMDVLSKAVETFAPLAQAVVSNRTAPALQHAAPVLPTQTPEVTMNAQEMQLKMALGFLVKQAHIGADPYTYACMVVDQVPEEELRAMLSQVEWKSELAKFAPEVANPAYSAWFDQLRVEVMGILTPEPETGNTPAHADNAVIPEA